jgi:hypothetical protein
MYCKDCEHWTRDTTGLFEPRFLIGSCDCEKFVYTGGDTTPVDGLGYEDGEGYMAGFETGELFGCIHFKVALK